jgi:dTDP-4-amino-4,6-dideoxy-D-galactose acyltransferase
MSPEYLDWDSKFFNLNVGRCRISRDELITEEELSDFDLVYIVVDDVLSAPVKKYFSSIAFFADEKLSYEKMISTTSPPVDQVLSWPQTQKPGEDLLDIGVQSGEFSRFNVDPNIPKQKFIELYQAWVINSANRRIAEEFYYFEEGGSVAGMITLAIKNNLPDIGILSVDKNFRGKGIAGNLVRAAEHWSKNIKGRERLRVVTQAANVVACRFYEKNGFSIHKREYVFHWWKRAKNKK